MSVEAQAVLGNFRLDFTDLTIPLAGIPIQIHRTYDTLNSRRSGDFGFGWQLSVSQPNLRESVRTSDAERSGIAAMFAANPFRDGTRVYLTTPAGRRVGFTFAPEPEGGVLGTIWHPRFVPDPGVYDQLTVADTPLSQRDDGTYTHYLVNLPYNPSEYSLTTKDGLTYRYDQFTGLLDIADRNQNVLTYTADGITSSTGVAIQFHRDAQGRITEITDPAGNAIRYTYDAAGDLATVTNQTGDVTTYFYRADPPHYFDHYVCPLCVPMVRTEYDQAGRVVGTYDVLGNPVTQTYDLANNTEIVADRLGNETTLDVRRPRQHRVRNEPAGPHRRLPIRCPRQSRCRRQRPRPRDPFHVRRARQRHQLDRCPGQRRTRRPTTSSTRSPRRPTRWAIPPSTATMPTAI